MRFECSFHLFANTCNSYASFPAIRSESSKTNFSPPPTRPYLGITTAIFAGLSAFIPGKTLLFKPGIHESPYLLDFQLFQTAAPFRAIAPLLVAWQTRHVLVYCRMLFTPRRPVYRIRW